MDGAAGVPLLEGTIAHFVCRTVERHEGGDHVIVVGEVEDYETFGGEATRLPLGLLPRGHAAPGARQPVTTP